MSVSERRKNHFLGITPGEWMGAVFVVTGLVGSYSVYGERVDNNSEKIASIEVQMEKNREELKQEIKASEQRTREDISDLRREIRQILRDGNGR